MKSARLLAALPAMVALSLAGTALAREQRRGLDRVANPAAVVATELAFARAAQEKGQWKAFRDYAAKDAVMFVPQPVNARDWLKKQPEPAQAVQWEPYRIWSSCDGSLAVSRGGWTRPDGSVGMFVTIWQRQKKGEYRWVLNDGKPLPAPMAKPEFLNGQVADCPEPGDAGFGDLRERRGKVPPPQTSDDGSLHYSWSLTPDGKHRHIVVQMRKGESMQTILDETLGGDTP